MAQSNSTAMCHYSSAKCATKSQVRMTEFGQLVYHRCNGSARNVMRSMASQHRKHRGYRTQRIVSDYMRQWFPFADSAGAGRTGSDILNVPFDVEVKARAGFDPKAAMNQLKHRESGKLGFAVLRLNGQGESPEDYCCIIRMDDLMGLFIQGGYTRNLTLEPERCDQYGHWKIKNQECPQCQSMNFNV